MKLGWSKGFYMAVNVGYSIGWGYPSENSNGSRVFSTFYVLVGSSAVAASLGYFAQSMIASSKNWYAKALTEQKFKSASSLEKCIYWAKMNESALQIIAMWFVWIVAMITFSLCTVKWNFSEALYFAVSSLSTGGLWAIPSDSPEWYFGIGTLFLSVLCSLCYCSHISVLRHIISPVGVFAATGIPLMALAMANIASMVITVGDPDEAEKIIAAKVTCEELHMMQKFDLDDGDGEISRAEYILLCAVRLGALSPELIDKINDRFKKLDKSGDGALSYAEILEHAEEETINIFHELKIIAERSPSNRESGSITIKQHGYQFMRTLSMATSKSFNFEGADDTACNSPETQESPQLEMSPVSSSDASPLVRGLSITNMWASVRAVSKDNIEDSLLGSDPLYSDQV